MKIMIVFRVFSILAWIVVSAMSAPGVARSLRGNPLRDDADLTLQFALALVLVGFGTLGFVYPATVHAMSDDETSFRTALYLGSALIGVGFAFRSRRRGCD